MPPKMKQCLIKISSSSEESSQGENTEMQVAPSIQAAMKRDPSPAIRNRPNKRIRLNENKRPQGNKTSAINSVATLDYSSPIRKPMNQSALSASYRQTVPLDITSKQSPRTKQRTLTLLNNNVPTTKPILAGSDLKHAFTSTSKLSPENKRALTAIVKPELEEEASFPTLTVAEQTELLAHNRKRATLTHITATIQSHLPDKAEQSHPASPESNPGVKVDSDHNLENDVRANSPTSFMEGPYKLPDISFFESHCWVCEIRLKEINGEPCLYGLNLHPVLQVPICSLCCDLIVIAQEEQVEDQNLTEDCIGCGKGDRGDLFLCDCCPNVFCTFCVAQAHGGGSTGTEKANSLLNDHDRSWACLECNAPAPLSGIQIHGKVINTDYLLSDDERDALTLDLFEKLMKVENEIVECEKWAKQDWLDQEKAKIASEFANQFNDSSELEKHVENEMAIYERQCLDHQHRLMDNVDTLQEKLECLNFDWQSYYKTFRDFASYEEESEWRAQAELSMTKVEPRQGENSDDDSLSDAISIEDLGTHGEMPEFETFKGENRDLNTGWSKEGGNSERTKRTLAKNLLVENERLRKIGRIIKYVHDDVDNIECQGDRKQSTVMTAGEVLVRQDAFQLTRHRGKNPSRRVGSRKRERTATSFFESDSQSNKHGANIPTKLSVTPIAQSEHLSSNSNEKKPLSNGLLMKTANKSCISTEQHTNRLFMGSSIVLSSTDQKHIQRSIAVATPLASKMKSHQVDAISFMWEKVCSDLALVTSYEEVVKERDVGGAILAHFMGLGKTAAVIALLHVLLYHPSLQLPRLKDVVPTRFIKTILLIVPVNTLENWIQEFRLWTDSLECSIVVHNFHILHSQLRVYMIEEWYMKGGVLLIGDRAFANISKEKITNKHKILREALHSPGPDLIVLDEGHVMLKSKKTSLATALGMVRTKRRIALTGTPFQNNLREYYRMASWVRPGILGTEAAFNSQFLQPIEDGMARDAEAEAVAMQVKKSKDLYQIMENFTQRRDSTILRKELPPLQESILHIRQSPLQRSLYAAFKRHSIKDDSTNFFRMYKAQFLVNNHPGTLLIPPRHIPKRNSKGIPGSLGVPLASRFLADSNGLGTSNGALIRSKKLPFKARDIIELLSDSDDDEDDDQEGKADATNEKECSPNIPQIKLESERTIINPRAESSVMPDIVDELWWKPVVAKRGEHEFTKVEQGKKIVFLLQILAYSQEIGDKVVIFSQSLPTLDFIENILSRDWSVYVNERNKFSPLIKLGGWEKQLDYYRIDGGTSASERGAFITSFNNGSESKAFLISIQAGGIGINLCGANRVVILDNHFNPAISSQAISRCWRYGQTKPVYAYRLLTEGSMEERIVANLSKKSGLGARVVDQEYPERSFTRRELTEMRSTDNWIACDRCEKWRMLIFETDEEVDDFHDKKWYCDMNQDRSHSKCKTPEKDAAWYSVNMRRLISLKARQENESHSNNQATSLDAVVPLSDPAKDAAVLEKTKQMIENDVILKKLGTLQLIDNHSSNEINTSSAEEPNQRKSIASKLFGKIYFPDLLSTHSTKDLDAAASYQKLLEDRAAADLKSVRDHDAAASHLQSLEESADKQMLFSPSGVGNWAMDTTVQVDKPESTQRVQQTSTNMASLTQLMDSQAKVVTPMMNQSNNHEPSITLGMPASDKLTNKLTTTNIGMGRPLVANKTLVTDELMQHALTAHIIAIDASGRQSREAVAEKSDKRDTQKRVLIEKSVREGKEQMQGFKAKNCSKGRKRAELVMNDTSSTVRPASSKESIASGKGNVKSEKREGVRTWGTEEKPLEILSDSDS